MQGDHISLQVGDISPAKCRIATGSESGVTVEKGERITLETFGENASLITSMLPKGRTTIPGEGEELLTLCNKLQIFVVLESPLQNFLNEPSGKSFLVFDKMETRIRGSPGFCSCFQKSSPGNHS